MKIKNVLMWVIVCILLVIGMYFLIYRDSQLQNSVTAPPPDYEKYNYGAATGAKILDIGSQPNSLSATLLTESIEHDRILQQQLASEGWTLREHGYRNGNDMLPYANGRLDFMILGDIPAFVAMNHANVGIFAVARQGYNSIVGKRILTPSALKGLRIGYSPKTVAHFAVERILTAAKLSMDDIITVPLQPDELELALQNNRVDAIAAWEPFVSNILNNVPGTTVISTSDTYSFVAIDLGFAAAHPNILKAILASIIRTTHWVRQNEANIFTSLAWIRQAGIGFWGSSPIAINSTWINLLRKESIDNSEFPMLPFGFHEEHALQHQQFDFLKKNSLLPPGADWKQFNNRVNIKLLSEIISEGSKWQIDTFNYAPENIYQKTKSVP